jgi:hypothetical protein
MTNRPPRQQCEQYSFAEPLRLSSKDNGMPQDWQMSSCREAEADLARGAIYGCR